MISVNWCLIAITCAFIALDVVTGLVKAVKLKQVSSTKMKDGLFHKCGFLLSMCLGIVCEFGMTQIDLGLTVPIMPAICGYICLTELASILENLCEITPELGDLKFLQIFKKKD